MATRVSLVECSLLISLFQATIKSDILQVVQMLPGKIFQVLSV